MSQILYKLASENTAPDTDDIRAPLPATLEALYVRGIKVIEELANRYGLHYLEAVFRGNTLGRDVQESSGK